MSWLTRKSVFDQFSAVKTQPDRSGSHHQNLRGRVCVVADGSTTVGSGIVQELLREGAVVVAPLATEEQVERLLADCDAVPTHKLFPVVTDVASEAAAAAFFQDVQQEHGGIDHAVSVFGTFWQGGPLTEQSVEELQRVLGQTTLAHFVFAKAALPALKQDRSASMLFISEGAGERMVSPESSLYTVVASALYGIILAAQDQYSETPLRVNEMRLCVMVKRNMDVADRSYQDVLGRKTYSNRKIGRLVAEALISSKPKERVVVTPATLDGATLTV